MDALPVWQRWTVRILLVLTLLLMVVGAMFWYLDLSQQTSDFTRDFLTQVALTHQAP